MSETETLHRTHLLTRKSALAESRIETETLPLALAPGEVWLKIDRVAITTNNITYAGLGESFQYWQYFPTDAPGWGHMPVWGFAHVLASRAEGVNVGERVFGYFPIASHLRVRAGRVSARGFHDVSPHRANLLSVYNQYTRCAEDPALAPANENVQAVIRPLFLTSFMAADFLREHRFFGARQIVVSSASSKTAYGTAFCLADEPGIELVGLTSGANRAFVAGLGCYRRVETYDTLSRLPADVPTLYADYAGTRDLRARVHQHFGDRLRYDCLVGSAQGSDLSHDESLPGPKPEIFFVAAQIEQRRRSGTADDLTARFDTAQRRFVERLTSPDDPWMTVRESHGFQAAERLIAELCAGRADPRLGNVVIPETDAPAKAAAQA